jgi:FkbM family methyltransferase
MSRPSWLKPSDDTWIGRAWHISTSYFDCFGLLRGVFLFTLSRTWQKSHGRRVKIVDPLYGVPLVLRVGTSDVMVFNDIYRGEEYAWNFGSAPNVIVDAGAYTGLSTSFFASRYPNATIIAIEPDEQNFELLVQNTARYPNVRAVRAALWAESGYVTLTDPGDDAWGLRLQESVTGEDKSANRGISVRAITMADIMRDFELKKIDLLKVDIEGSEKEVFDAADSWIAAIDAICVELHDRFKVGCSESFFNAVKDFGIELRRGEDVLVAREQSQLKPVPAPAAESKRVRLF